MPNFPAWVPALGTVCDESQYNELQRKILAYLANFDDVPLCSQAGIERLGDSLMPFCCLGLPCMCVSCCLDDREGNGLEDLVSSCEWDAVMEYRKISFSPRLKSVSLDEGGLDQFGRVLLERDPEPGKGAERVPVWPPSGSSIVLLVPGTEMRDNWPKRMTGVAPPAIDIKNVEMAAVADAPAVSAQEMERDESPAPSDASPPAASAEQRGEAPAGADCPPPPEDGASAAQSSS